MRVNSTPSSPHRSPASLLCHPALLSSIAVLAVNDHLFKGSGWLPGAVTGKLGDVAGLFFFPVLLGIILHLAVSALPVAASTRSKRRVALGGSTVLTAGLFSALNLVGPLNEFAADHWGVFTMDPTDLWCLPMVAVAYRFATRRWPRSSPGNQPTNATPPPALRWRDAALLLAASLVSIGTPAPPETTPAYPTWTIPDQFAHCHRDLEVHSWFAKSGKEGAGLVLRFDNTAGQSRNVAVTEAILRIRPPRAPADETVHAIEARQSPSVTVDDQNSVYLPFVFDNNEAWNDNLRVARLVVSLTVDGEPVRLQYRALHREAPWTVTYEPLERAFPFTPWGLADDLPGPERTGPARASYSRTEWLVRDPNNRRDPRIRFAYTPDGGCNGDADD